MKLYKCFILAVVFATFSLCNGHIGGSHIRLQDIEPQMYCGRTLSSALELLCYVAPRNGKRGVAASVYKSIMPPHKYQEQEPEAVWSWLLPNESRVLSLPSRGKRYIVNECCDKPCSVEELLSYC